MTEEEKLRKENRKLRGALAFYADPETYHAITVIGDRPCGAFAEDFSDGHGHEDYDRGMPGHNARVVLGFETEKGDAVKQECEFEECEVAATQLAYDCRTGGVGIYCAAHATAAVTRDTTEYITDCVNCGCRAGVG